MTSIKVTLLFAVFFAYVVSSPIGCNEDSHCPSGSFCLSNTLLCKNCINCELLKRAPPTQASTCIMSVADCGSCFKGLIANWDNECTLADDQGLLPYEWATIAVALLLFAAIICGFAAYILRNFETFKVFTYCIRTSIQVSDKSDVASIDTVMQPPPPPPYNAVVSASEHDKDCINMPEEYIRFIKPISSPIKVECRELPDDQGVRVINSPAYPLRTKNLTRYENELPTDDSEARNNYTSQPRAQLDDDKNIKNRTTIGAMRTPAALPGFVTC